MRVNVEAFGRRQDGKEDLECFMLHAGLRRAVVSYRRQNQPDDILPSIGKTLTHRINPQEIVSGNRVKAAKSSEVMLHIIEIAAW